MEFFRLIRIGNLAMLALAQCLVYYMVVVPLLKVSEFTPSLYTWQFALIVLCTALITAGGYAINDFFDKDIDAANGIRKTPNISPWAMKTIYFSFSLIAVAIGAYLTYGLKLRQFALIFLLTSALLYFYSASYKRLPLVGNFVVAFLSALAIFLPAFADYEMQYAFRDIKLPVVNERMYNLRLIIAITSAYSLFAFLMTFVREIIKDLEDMEGDRMYGCKTLPVVAGTKLAKYVAIFFLFLIFILLVMIQIHFEWWSQTMAFFYQVAAIQLPLLALVIYLFLAKEKKQFHLASLLAKLTMLGGILSLPVLYYSGL
ncbi:MAG: geranylgeranylglycerol-phosphate geranylgeranyltransferase [Bacteroidetes bacterium]|jgi:4-hydroxybenzoate polyprenyltransferase|nr:geranylgeranylglycerol-phosphate geranylgeranyltransferase [Bacteroidota bacterium]